MKGNLKKKLLSIITAMVMVMLMVIPSSAEAAYKAVAGGKPSFKKYLVMNASAEVPNVTFSYTIAAGAAAEGSDTKLEVYAGNDPTKVAGTPSIGTASFTSSSTQYDSVQTDDDSVDLQTGQVYSKELVEIDLSGVTFKEPGVYRYIITETQSTVAGVTYDPIDKRTLDVYVIDNGSRELEIKGYVLYEGVINTAPSSGTSAAALGDKSDNYRNTYAAYNVEISKDVSGNQASKDEYFLFTINITDAAPSTTFNVDISHADATTSENAINTEAKTNDASYTTDASGEATLEYWLQAGQRIILKGLTEGTKYTISENADTLSKEGYTTSIAKSGEDTDGTANGVQYSDTTSGVTGDATIAYTNNKQGVIPTGVILKATGLIVVGLIVIIGVVFFGVRSKRRYEED